jgi:hypothetical protein
MVTNAMQASIQVVFLFITRCVLVCLPSTLRNASYLTRIFQIAKNFRWQWPFYHFLDTCALKWLPSLHWELCSVWDNCFLECVV